jgi:hypothetical protein
MADIFLSYKREDRERVRPIVEALERQGWSVWWDPDLVVGQLWDPIIEKELDAAKCIVVIWSKLSLLSREVRNEALVGRERERLVQVTIDGVAKPLTYSIVHSADLTRWTGDAKDPRFQEVCAGVKLLVDKTSKGTHPAKGVLKTLDQLDLGPVEARLHTLMRKHKVDKAVAWENLMFSLYVETRKANKQLGRPDTPTALVGPDKFSRTNWGEELVSLQGSCLKETPPKKVQEFHILLHPEESEKLLEGFKAGFIACMLELKKQLEWTDPLVAPVVTGIGEQRRSGKK